MSSSAEGRAQKPPPMSSSGSTATLKQGTHSPQLGRPRGLSTSTLRQSVHQMQSAGQGLSRVSEGLFPDFVMPNYEYDKPTSSFISRSRSKSQSYAYASALVSPTTVLDQSPGCAASEGPTSPPAASWWGHSLREEMVPRPWRDSPKRKGTVPAEQTDSWIHTKEVSFIPSTFGVYRNEIHALKIYH